MAVKIELLERYQLRAKRDNPNVLDVPVIELAPLGSNLPHISSVSLSVTGNPPEIAELIKSAYTEFSAPKPIKLSAPQRLRQQQEPELESLPAKVDCTLDVIVEYFDSDTGGNPALGEIKTATASCDLFYRAKQSTPSPSPAREPAVAPPTIIQSETETTATAGTQSQPESKKPVPEINYPGWFAIDFGTSNSTITLFDPKLTVSPDSLPKEQEKRLRDALAEWLNQRPTNTAAGVTADSWKSQWQKFLDEICKEFPDLDASNQNNLGDKIFLTSSRARLLEAIRSIEIGLSIRLDWFRKAASERLNQIYHEVFRVPPLEWQSLIPVELDGLRKASEIPSELEVENLVEVSAEKDVAETEGKKLEEEDSPTVKVSMGERARQNRLNAIAKGEDIKGKFHHSPKRYLGQDRNISVSLDGSSEEIPVAKLIQAAFSHLIELTEDYRQRNTDKCSVGQFNTAVVTYPTIAPPRVREEVEQLVSKLGIQNVQMAYDEAVSVAIFFLWREFGGDLRIGIESFKTRCRRSGEHWSQNVLVLDIGGGTTDLALINLSLQEKDPFQPNEDRGDGGRYYVLTPKLLGSSGHLQLGGELITLRIFRLLKVALADCLLSAVARGDLQPDLLKVRPDELSDRFVEDGKFKTGSLLACLDNDNPEADVAYKDALDTADKLLPTRWKNAPSRQQTFYSLWEHAEKAKLLLGQSNPEDLEPTFLLDGQQISELLAQNELQLPETSLGNLTVKLTLSQFERAVTPDIKEAIGIAKGLMESSLRRQNQGQSNSSRDSIGQNADESNSLKEQLDWLILSGKTCNLDLVKGLLYQEFSKSDCFVWNPERITFVPEYTKLATSAGACYAEKLRQLIFAPEDAKEVLRKGANQLYIDVKNLLYFLPCSFELGTQDRPLRVFKAGQQLYQLAAGDRVAKVRSDRWYGAQLLISIYRKDFEDKTPQLWGSFQGQALANQLRMSGSDFNEKINVQFEIDQELNISLLFCQGKPQYAIPDDIPSLDATEAIKTKPVISDGKVAADIAVDVLESAIAHQTDAHTVVFSADKDYSDSLQVFWQENGKTESKGLISEPLPPFPMSGKHTFYFQMRDPNTDKWERIGELPQPVGKTDYPCEYRVTLDEGGILRIHAGEIPYVTLESEDALQYEGSVFRTKLESQPNDVEEKRNPFSGIH